MGKIQWNVIAIKQIFSQVPKLGRYYWFRLYTHAKRVCKDFETKNLLGYHDLHVQGDTLLLADVFENFRNMCLGLYWLDPAIHWYASNSNANNKYMKYYDKNKESSYLKFWHVNSLHGWTMLQQVPVDDFKWVKNISQFNKI